MKSLHPQWALAHKKPGTELRCLKGYYYLYEVTSKWDAEKKRSKKITGKLLGRITEVDGFIESEKRRLQYTNTHFDKLSVKEFGISHFIETHLCEYTTLLQKHFPQSWQEILCLAYGRLVERSPLKNMEHYYHHSFLSEKYPGLHLSASRLSSLLKQLGYDRSSITAFFKEFQKADDCILFDGTDIHSQSKKIELCDIGKSKDGTFDQLINAMYIFSTGANLPVYYKLLSGKTKDVKAFKLCLKESGIENAVIIADKGFHSASNIEALEKENLQYVIPLMRNNALIDYRIIKNNNKQDFDGYFEYEKRFIWHYQIKVSYNRRLIVFLDEELRSQEQKDYLGRIENPKLPKFTLENYYKNQHTFGTIAMLTNTEEKAASDVYQHYKSRMQVEEMIDSMKNVLEADRTYMQNEQTLEAWMFINYIALHWYYRILHLLKQYQLNRKFSPADFLLKIKEIRKVKINELWHLSEITAKTTDLLKKVKAPIT